jgi:hypothetical protein
MIGSTTTYQYSDSSDIDINVHVKLTTAQIDDIWDFRPNEKLLAGTKHPINYFIANDTKGVDKSVALYDVLANKWIRKPQKNITEIPFDYISGIAQFFIDGINLRISDYEKEHRSFEYYKTKKGTFSTEEWDDMIRDKERDIDSALDSIYVGWHMIHAFRSEGFEDEAKTFIIQVQSADPNYSINNLVYKEMEKIGFFDKVKPYIDIRKKRLEK